MGRRVLVVDDDALLRDLVGTMLEELGCEVIAARSGTEALAAISKDESISILISDIRMPGISGSELANRVRSFRRDIGIILISGDGSDQRGAFPLLQKPFSQSDLQRCMEQTTGLCN